MKSYTARLSERGLALVAVFSLVLGMFIVFGGSPAQGVSDSCATSQNWQSFTFTFVNGASFSGDNCPGSPYAVEQDGNSQESFLPGTGGHTAALDGPGMTLHTSCSDVYEDGWGSSGNQPDETSDSAWQLASFSIYKYHNESDAHASCDQPWDPPTTTTTTIPETTTTIPETTTTFDEVLGTTITVAPTSVPETLPFTGVENEQMVGIAMMLLSSGVLLILFGRGLRDEG